MAISERLSCLVFGYPFSKLFQYVIVSRLYPKFNTDTAGPLHPFEEVSIHTVYTGLTISEYSHLLSENRITEFTRMIHVQSKDVVSESERSNPVFIIENV